MTSQDQGRREHGWFGNGTSAADKQTGGSNDAALFAPKSVAARMTSVIHGSTGALPSRLRGHPAARPNAAAVDRMSGLMIDWSNAAKLGPARFADHFFDRDANDPAVEKLRAAANAAATARDHGDLREASTDPAGAKQDIGLDRWSRFIADAKQRADQPLGIGAALTSGVGAILRQLGEAQSDRGGTSPADRREGREPWVGRGTRRPARPRQNAGLQHGAGSDQAA
jgi:hypothetical protein